MSVRVVLRSRAVQEVREAVEFYSREGGEKVTLLLVDALERAFRHVSRHPSSGSQRFAHELGIPGLRAWPVSRFPDLAFYLAAEGSIDIWRVLQTSRDLPGSLRDDAGP